MWSLLEMIGSNQMFIFATDIRTRVSQKADINVGSKAVELSVVGPVVAVAVDAHVRHLGREAE